MYQYQVSVVVCTYNPKWEKLKSTLSAILAQKDIDFEIVIADDGSEIQCFDKAEQYFKKSGFKNYILVSQQTNVGTVKNFYHGICNAKGEYIYGISPGDMLYDDSVLRRLYEYMKTKDAKVCFGNVVYYTNEDNNIQILENKLNAPIRPWYFSEKYPLKKVKEEFLLDNHILGAAFFRETETAKKYIGEMIGVSKYTEDNTTTAFLLADGIRVYHFDEFVVWYEYGSGVSTSNNKKWEMLLERDFDQSYELMSKKYPNDTFIQDITKLHVIKNRYVKYVYALFICPSILFRKIKNRFSNKSIGYNREYDKSILIRYLKMEE